MAAVAAVSLVVISGAATSLASWDVHLAYRNGNFSSLLIWRMSIASAIHFIDKSSAKRSGGDVPS